MQIQQIHWKEHLEHVLHAGTHERRRVGPWDLVIQCIELEDTALRRPLLRPHCAVLGVHILQHQELPPRRREAQEFAQRLDVVDSQSRMGLWIQLEAPRGRLNLSAKVLQGAQEYLER